MGESWGYKLLDDPFLTPQGAIFGLEITYQDLVRTFEIAYKYDRREVVYRLFKTQNRKTGEILHGYVTRLPGFSSA